MFLRPYQAEAKQKTWQAHHSGKRRVLIQMATGLGKTINAAFFADEWLRAKNGRMLFLVHTIDATIQARRKFHDVIGDRFESGEAYNRVRDHINARMLFSTFDTVSGLLASGEIRAKDFSLVIVDEAHHGQAETYCKVIKAFKKSFLYGMTATPDRMDGKDIRDLFGDEIYTYSLAKALTEKEWLAEVFYHLYHDNMSLKALRRFVKRVCDGERKVSREQLNKLLFVESELEEVYEEVRRHQKEDTRTIIFCSSVEHVLQVVDRFEEAEAYYSNLVGYRGAGGALERFRTGELKTIVVVDMLNEAIDVPEADLIVFYRGTNSKRIWLQQLGRGLRRTKDKQHVTVLDFVGNCDRVLWMHDLAAQVAEFSGNELLDELLVIPSEFFTVKFTRELVDLNKALRRLATDSYETWEQASQAARAMGIRDQRDYRKRYREDPRLPSAPWKTYPVEWEVNHSWYGFLGKEVPMDPYETWEEAAEAARNLRIESVSEYNERYKEDPKLPSRPSRIYEDVWRERGGYPGFLDTIGRFYSTWEEASQAARVLSIETRKQYYAMYQKDPKLPRSPESAYSASWRDNGGWRGFLGTSERKRLPGMRLRRDNNIPIYETWEEASKATLNLGIRTIKEYGRLYRLDPNLPSNPASAYQDVWEQNGYWRGFLGQEIKDMYPTWEEASEAAKRLGITSSSEYHKGKRYKEDPRLHSNPWERYRDVWEKNGGWHGFLGKEKKVELYETWEEASGAVKRLGIVNSSLYRDQRKGDPRLPAMPHVKYADVWEKNGRWYGYLGKEVPVVPYETWEEASEAARKLRVRSSPEYKKVYQQDPRLTLSPEQKFKDVWKERGGWRGFLGRLPYETWEEASKAAQALGITKCTEYTAKYKADPRLHGCPGQQYKDVWKQNGGWKGFLGKLDK